MPTLTTIKQAVNSIHGHSSRGEVHIDMIVDCIKTGVNYGIDNPRDQEEVAYLLAGLLSLPQIVQLPDRHPVMESLEILGELELPSRHRSAEASWERLGQLMANGLSVS